MLFYTQAQFNLCVQGVRVRHALELGDEAGEGVVEPARGPDVEFWVQGGKLGGHDGTVLSQLRFWQMKRRRLFEIGRNTFIDVEKKRFETKGS